MSSLEKHLKITRELRLALYKIEEFSKQCIRPIDAAEFVKFTIMYYFMIKKQKIIFIFRLHSVFGEVIIKGLSLAESGIVRTVRDEKSRFPQLHEVLVQYFLLFHNYQPHRNFPFHLMTHKL